MNFFSEMEGALKLVGAPSRLALKSFLVKVKKGGAEVTDHVMEETETKVTEAVSLIEQKLREQL